jgi:hypothetical protein
VGANTLLWDVAETSLAEPVAGQTGVEVPVVEGLKRQPAALDLVWVPELGVGRDQVVSDVHVLVLTLHLFVCMGGQFGRLIL